MVLFNWKASLIVLALGEIPQTTFWSSQFYTTVGKHHKDEGFGGEDSWFRYRTEVEGTKVDIAAVFDGHGTCKKPQPGGKVSLEAARLYSGIVDDEIQGFIKDKKFAPPGTSVAGSRQAVLANTLVVLNKKLKKSLGLQILQSAGTTATVLALLEEQKEYHLMASNVGDSRAVALIYQKNSSYSYSYSFYVQLTSEDNIRQGHARDEVSKRLTLLGYTNEGNETFAHPEKPKKFSFSETYLQLSKNGEYVSGLQLTASIGDYELLPAKRNYQPSHKVQVLHFVKDLHSVPESLAVVVLGSDGLWDEIRHYHIVKELLRRPPEQRSIHQQRLMQQQRSIKDDNHALGYSLEYVINQSYKKYEFKHFNVGKRLTSSIATTLYGYAHHDGDQPYDDTTFYVLVLPIKKVNPDTL